MHRIDSFPAGFTRGWTLACGHCGQDCAIDVVKQRDDHATKTGFRTVALAFECPDCGSSCRFLSEKVLADDLPEPSLN